MPTIIDPRGRHVALSRSGEIAILDMDGRELSTHRVPYGAHLLCESGHIVSRGDRIAEWDPSYSPVITEKAGTVKYQDLIENRTLTEQTDESTGITQRVVTDDHGQVEEGGPSSAPDPARRGQGRRRRSTAWSPGAIIAVEDGQTVEAGEVLARTAARSRQDARHHRRSAARRRAVRGAQAQGECDHRQGLGQGQLQQGL